MTVFAPPADPAAYGAYGTGRLHTSPEWNRPLYPFQGRIGGEHHPAEPGRYHLYAAHLCPWAQRAAIVRTLAGLDDVVGLSYVDDERDGRGWAFRERRGADPVNGFAFLEQAYDATEPGYAGHISVPVLWDRVSGRIVSNHYPDITIDLATRFERWADPGVRLYPAELRVQIDARNDEILREINHGAGRVGTARTQEDYDERRRRVVAAFERLDAHLGERRYLVGNQPTEADVRLWVTLARFDLGYNPAYRISERPLTAFPNLWAYARDLYQRPAFRDTTDFTAFGLRPAEEYPDVKRIDVPIADADWDEPHHRGEW
ncbi:glutathione S-transferase C-terminal domain-containing protein [Nonomuraea typhae]|uniref:glutathione S-transferase C-terminal domain-containing protein n=1 Tax=Nonomuraea typhae TaxID=2603600 RepID=UPI0012F95EC5|nr:glutathione S-transferase C-terminal domain-containing protein [Nonomuraea typhae]